MLKLLRNVRRATAVAIGIGGESRRRSETTVGSGTNAALEPESGTLVVVAHRGAGGPTGFDAVHPEGSAGAPTPSKSCVKTTVGIPAENDDATAPRLAAPSVRSSVVTTVWPHASAGSTVNDTSRHTAGPPAVRTPKSAAPDGLVTPPEGCSVAMRSVVSALPVFCMQNVTVTGSPGSGMPLAGRQPSAESVASVEAITGIPEMQPFSVAAPPPVIVTGPPAVEYVGFEIASVYDPGGSVI